MSGQNLEPALIQASNLYKVFTAQPAVNLVNLSVAPGEIYGLMGPDGAGKTTTMRLLCGAMLPTPIPTRNASRPANQPPAPLLFAIHIAGYDMMRQPEQARAQIGYLPQRFSLYEELTVLENIRFFAEVRGLPSARWRPRCMEILEFVGLESFINRKAGQLSGGMKQKLGLAAALVHNPRVLLLDEPTTGVDPVTRQDFWQLIIHLIGEGVDTPGGTKQAVTVFVSTPYMDEAARCHRIGFMMNGRLIQEGTPASLRAHLSGRIVELRGHPLTLLRRLSQADPGVEDVQMFGDRMHIRTHPGEAETIIHRLQASITGQGGQVNLLRQIPVQLEDVFMDLVSTTHIPGQAS